MSAFKYTNKLQNARVLVVGGSSGMGFAVAEAAVEHGAIVTIASSTQAKLDKAVARLQEHARAVNVSPDTITSAVVDLSKADTIDEQAIKMLDVATKDGKLDHIVFSAGDSFTPKPLPEVSVQEYQQLMMVRAMAPMVIAKYVNKYMNVSTKSSITVTSGTVSWRPPRGWATIAAVGSMIEGLTRGLASDLRPVRVNCVTPGVIRTEMFDGMPAEHLPMIMDTMAKESILGTVGTPQEIAEAYLYCMKDSFATSIVIESSGGRLVGDSKPDMFGN
ncbi:hypothetical protein VHEMI04247 [[Torrubiella] hemipterigena]|uniref:Short chain dehydrogenase n=1 Tax=[Torrubiella] hemipterigena TaxID=1531966 RepID=A0A0A1SUT6_9HYPO|nr:hypothetical protein VHEMI04247 [[Torrubiella] hemipterigena]